MGCAAVVVHCEQLADRRQVEQRLPESPAGAELASGLPGTGRASARPDPRRSARRGDRDRAGPELRSVLGEIEAPGFAGKVRSRNDAVELARKLRGVATDHASAPAAMRKAGHSWSPRFPKSGMTSDAGPIRKPLLQVAFALSETPVLR